MGWVKAVFEIAGALREIAEAIRELAAAVEAHSDDKTEANEEDLTL